MFDHLSSAPFEGRDARMLSSISEAIFVEEAPSDHHSLTNSVSLDDTVLVLLREYAGLKADQEERAYWQHRLDSLTRNHTPEEDDEGIEDADIEGDTCASRQDESGKISRVNGAWQR